MLWKIINFCSRLVVAGSIALAVRLYPFLYQRLAVQGAGQNIAFHVAYALVILALLGGIVTSPSWLRAGVELLKIMPVRSVLLLFNLLFFSLFFLTIFTQWGVVAWMLIASMVAILFHLLGEKRRRKAFEKITRKFLLSFGLFYLALGMGELYFRLHPEQVGGGGGGNPALRSFYSGLYSTNSYGLRDDEFDLVPPEDTYRILMLGDSFLFGQGVSLERTFPKQTEKLLGARGEEISFEVINAGKRGINTYQELNYLEEHGWSFDPDLVVVQFYANDIEVTEESPAEKRSKFIDIVFKKPFRQSHLIFYLRRCFNEFQYALIKQVDEELPQDYLWGLYRLLEMNSLAWKQCSGAFARFAELGRERSVPVVVVLFPHPGAPHEAVPLIHEAVGAFCKEQGLHVLDLLDGVRAIPPDRQLVMPFDHHPSAEYHAVAAKRLVEALDGWMLLPR